MAKFYRILIMALAAGLFSTGVQGQTYRVNVGSPSAGCTNYIEVYEYDYVTEKPTFPGGTTKLMSFINENRCYPKEAYKKGIQGRVTCSFIVNTDGTISHISVLRGVEPTLNREAIRVLSKMPQWTPGKIGGEAVPTRVVRSVCFRK